MNNKIWPACIFFLVLLNVYLFWPGKLYFLNDDLLHIPLTGAGQFFQTNSVRPLHELLVQLDLFIWDKQAFGFHITALLLHFIVCIQLYNLSYVIQTRWLKIGRDQAYYASSLAVILFLLYPQHSESLAWILGRTPVLSAIFFLASVRLFFVKQYTRFVYVTGALFFAAALFTYEQGFLFPVMLLLFYFLQKEQNKRQQLIYCIVMAGVSLVYIVARLLITSEVVGNYEGENFRSFNFLVLLSNGIRLLLRLFVNPGTPAVFLFTTIAFLFVCIGVFLLFRKKVKMNKNAALLFLATILILIAPIISLGIPVTSFESGRFIYIPSIFLVIGLSIAGVSAYYHNIQLRTALTSVLLLLSCYWLFGKYQASGNYLKASSYASSIQNKVQQHFATSADTLHIDTLHGSIYRLPVYRLGFKTGVKWLNSNIDTNKIIIDNYMDDVEVKQMK